MHTTKNTNNRKGEPFFWKKTIVFKLIGGNIKIESNNNSNSNNTGTNTNQHILVFSLVLVKFVCVCDKQLSW